MRVGERGILARALLDAGATAATALTEGGRRTTYGELRDLVDRRRSRLELPPRSLVVVELANTVASVVGYLALLAGEHVPLLAGRHSDALAGHWSAAAVLRADGTLARRDACGAASAPELHPDLALLLSTSGSTGTPKLVRLSSDNVVANARAIAAALELTAHDRAITSLPLHYCYGLSVLHSHLAVGGSVVVTEASVVDPCFATAMREGGVTTLAGVPHTFELLERAGPERVRVPSLRLVTQAGGRMAPDRVRAWDERLRAWGAGLAVMYGQTEATARMAVLPPALAGLHPQAVGRAVGDGRFELRPADGAPEGVGELVYHGPNVMLGYATAPGDLSLGRTVDELATGDLARFVDGTDLVEIVGRRARFVKPFGVRVDLDAVEQHLRSAGIDAVAGGDDTCVVIGAPGADAAAVARDVVSLTGLPAGAVLVDDGDIPRTAAGKVDYAALRARATRSAAASGSAEDRPAVSVADVYREVLGREDVDATSTFISLGGDSLNYVECSVRLERRLGRLPADWHLRTVADLERTVGAPGPARLDTTVLLRALGVAAVVATHMSLWYFPGGAHLMLAVVGYNLGRFQLSLDRTAERLRAMARTVARIAIPVVVLVGACMLTVGGYGLPTLTFTNNYLGPPRHLDGRWHYWFIEVVVQLLVVVSLVMAVPAVRRVDRRHPYLVALALVGVAMVFRYELLSVAGGNLRFRTHGVAWFFLLGLLAQRATTDLTRIVTMAVIVGTVPGFFVRTERGVFIAVGILLLLWCRDLPLPRLLVRPISVIAAASMWIYVSHFRIWPVLDRNLPIGAAYVATLAAGVAIWWAAEQSTVAVRRAWTAREQRTPNVALAPLAVATE